jgi:hypothetical protein
MSHTPRPHFSDFLSTEHFTDYFMIASRTIMAGMSLPVLHPVSENLYLVAYRELEA